jgi:hypothetical protein
VFVKIAGAPFVHDTYQRNGLLFVGLWNDGVDIWDIGGCGSGASPENPRTLGNVKTWAERCTTSGGTTTPTDRSGSRSSAEEGPGSIGSSSRGDIHVIDITDPTAPKEVAFYRVTGAGTHNFSVDETKGVLYAAYYNGGVRAIDVRGDLGTCADNQKATDATSGLVRCDLRLMGRELSLGLTDLNRPGVHLGGAVRERKRVCVGYVERGLEAQRSPADRLYAFRKVRHTNALWCDCRGGIAKFFR